MQPDSTDWKIINILREEHVSNNAIARKLGVSEGMIRQRLRKLKEHDILRVRAQINPAALDNQQLALVAINVIESHLLDEKAKEIAALDGVQAVSIATGRYDLLAEILVQSNKGLVQFLIEVLSKVEGITTTESFLMLKSYNKYV